MWPESADHRVSPNNLGSNPKERAPAAGPESAAIACAPRSNGPPPTWQRPLLSGSASAWVRRILGALACRDSDSHGKELADRRYDDVMTFPQVLCELSLDTPADQLRSVSRIVFERGVV